MVFLSGRLGDGTPFFFSLRSYPSFQSGLYLRRPYARTIKEMEMGYVASVTCPELPMKIKGYYLHFQKQPDGYWYVWATQKGVLQSESVMNSGEAWVIWTRLTGKGWAGR